jgi:ubiquinone/menaquinone biosynthesis C-methylase UbiE
MDQKSDPRHLTRARLGLRGQLMSTELRREPYDTYAVGYAQRLDPTLSSATERLAELAGACRGMRLLDVATGTGAVAGAAVRRGASVVGVDRSPGMLAVARELSPELDVRVAEASALPFERGTFDAVTCGLSVSHFADRDQALYEVLRVLRPGGRLVASTWGEGSSFPTGAVGELFDHYRARAPSEALDERAWLSPERGSSVLRRTGFASVSVTTESFTGAFSDADEALAWSVAWPRTASRLASLDSSLRERFLRDARRALVGKGLSWRFAFNFYLASKSASA